MVCYHWLTHNIGGMDVDQQTYAALMAMTELEAAALAMLAALERAREAMREKVSGP